MAAPSTTASVASAVNLHGFSAYRHEVLSNVYAKLTAESKQVDALKLKPLGVSGDVSINSVDDFLSVLSKTDLASKPVESFDVAVNGLSQSYPNRLRFDLTPAAVKALTDEIKDRIRAVNDQVAAIPAGEHTFENTVLAISNVSAALNPLRSNVTFVGHVSADKSLRDASFEKDKALTAFDVEQNMRLDVYKSIVAYKEKAEPLTGANLRLLDRWIRDYRRQGLHLDEAARSRIGEIQTKMGTLGIQFSKNLGEENTVLEFTKEELAGFPADNLNRLKTTQSAEGVTKYQMTLKYPDYLPAMKYISVEDTRRRLEKAFNSRCIDVNTQILEELVQLRAEKAHILGHKTHAEFVLDIRMAKTPETVANFLHDLSNKLDPLADSDRAALLALKRAEKEQQGVAFDGKLHPWDVPYYSRVREEKEFQVNREEIKQYFPLEVVTAGLLDIYQELLSLKYELVPNAHTWHPEVTLYRVLDKFSGEFLGHFYLDLHPRDGKYGHAACFGLQASCITRIEGKEARQPSAAACVANFSPATPDKPSLLNHDEVVTFFHEFGHVMHQLCARTTFTTFAGTACERDFVEAPSQMLENWCWQKESLLRMSGHVADRSKKLPDDLLHKLVAAKNANAGFFNKRQLVFGIYDQTLHTMDKADTAGIYAKVLKEVMGLDATPGTNVGAGFAHLAGGYDATYYGYMWSEVYAADMFYSRFKKEGIFNPAVGMDYRKFILEPGGERDSIDNLVTFLGRQPTFEAFLQSKGLGAQ